jgi:Flp pilus assembly pilin Flp
LSAKFKQFLADENASTMVEHSLTMGMFFVILFGIIEFSFIYYQWNAAAKAVQFGARQAAVSNPIPTGFSAMTGVGGSVFAGDPMPDFDITCIGTNTAGSAVSCTGTITTATPAALQALVFGRDPATGVARSICDFSPKTTEAQRRGLGMCNYMFGDRLQGNNVRVRYDNTGLGFAGRPGGPVPTITVSLSNMQYQFIFLSGLMNFTPVNLPSFATTVTGEDLNVVGP